MEDNKKYRLMKLIESSQERLSSTNELIKSSCLLLDLFRSIGNDPFYPELKNQMEKEIPPNDPPNPIQKLSDI